MHSITDGLRYFPEFLSRPRQQELVTATRQIVRTAPLFVPKMPKTGKPFSVRMTNSGRLGWVSDQAQGYRYQPTHPQTGEEWPPIPDLVLAIWQEVSDYPQAPEACLINYYVSDAKMGLHQDKDEENYEAPVVSISLGDSCLFRVGSKTRGGKTSSIKLNSGDVVVLGGAARLHYHGVDRIYPGTSTVLSQPGRINLTLRRVTAAC